MVTEWLLPLLAGAATGVLSGFGVGGGTLLLIYLTAFAGLPAAAASLPAHAKNGFLEKSVLLPAIAAGLVCAALGAWAATGMDTALLRRCFGGFLILIGLRELFARPSGK